MRPSLPLYASHASSSGVGIKANCDICKRTFSASPDNIIECFVLESWENEPEIEREPDQYLFVCPTCEIKYVHLRDDGT